MLEIIVAGVGPGSVLQITSEVIEAIKNSDCILTSSRHEHLIPSGKKIISLRDFDSAFSQIEHESGKVLILVSGDPGIYSLMPLVKKRFPGVDLKVLPGISSLQALCSSAGEIWQDAVILSGHGRILSKAKFLNTVERNKLVILFCDKNISPLWACEALADIEGKIEIVIGERLSCPDEQVRRGRPQEFLGCKFDSLSIILVKNVNPYSPPISRVRDKDFIRSPRIPMTNEVVRSVILDRLFITEDSVLWDIGAGSGSVSVSVGLECPDCEIHAVEHNPEATDLILRNAARFHLHNVKVHSGRASEIIKKLPAPSHVFIGGSGGELSKILGFISKLDCPVRVLLSCVTLETLSEAVAFFKSPEFKNFEAVQVAISISKTSGKTSLTLMSACNPVTILSVDFRSPVQA